MTNEELIKNIWAAAGLHSNELHEWRAELLRLLGAAVSASPQPRCPKCHGKVVLRNLFNEPTAFCAVQCPTCIPTDGFWLIHMAEDMSQFFAAAPAQEPRQVRNLDEIDESHIAAQEQPVESSPQKGAKDRR